MSTNESTMENSAVNAVRFGTAGKDLLIGTDKNDAIFGLDGDDRLEGGAGDDILNGGAGKDFLLGGTGYDVADYTDSDAGVTAKIGLFGYGGHANGDYIEVDVEAVRGSSYADNLFTYYSSGELYGMAGNDRLNGSLGNDWLDGGDGDDWLSGGGGSYDFMKGGDGFDTASYASSNAGVSVNLPGLTVGRSDHAATGGHAAGDILISIEGLEGSNFDDTLFGNDSNNRLSGGNGFDILNGWGGNDVIEGGNGNDTVSYSTSTAGVNVNLLGGFGHGGDAEMDYLYGDFENFLGSAHDDIVYGNALMNILELGLGNDYAYGGDSLDNIRGEGGNDVLYGEGGSDGLEGGAGNDLLVGGEGNDVLDGGTGDDQLIGGAGGDAFVYGADGGFDVILDFNGAQGDKVNFVAMDANTQLAGNNAFQWIGSAAFSGHAGELHSVVVGNDLYLAGDLNGDRGADFSIKLLGVHAIDATMIVL